MSEFIVLGIIPGTQLQINFALWIMLTSILLVGAALWVGYRTRAFRNWLITLTLFTLTKTNAARL